MPLDDYKRWVYTPEGRFTCIECKVCGFTSINSGALSRHIMAKHPESIKSDTEMVEEK